MSNEEILSKMREDMEMRGFSHYTKEQYEIKVKDLMKYLNKSLEEVTVEELRNYLLKHLTMDKVINKKQLPMYRNRRMIVVLTKEELSAFFNACKNYKYKTIFMLIYGSGLRVSEAVNLRIEEFLMN